MTVGKAIYYLLTNSTDVTDIVSTRVYPEIAEQNAALPYVVYNISNNEPTDTKPEPSKLDTAQIEVNVYSESYTECIDLSVAVRAALDRVKGTYNGVNVQSIQYINEIIDFDEPQRAYNIASDYDVRISRSGFEIAQGSPITGVELGELSDVNVTGVTDNQVLSYDAATDTWVPAIDAGGASELSDLSDVSISLPNDGEVLIYSGGEFVNDNIAISSVTGLQSELDGIPDSIFDLSDVGQSGGSIAANSTLKYIDGQWTNSAPEAPTPVYDELSDLTDTTITTPTDNQFLRYNGTKWVNETVVQYHGRFDSEAETLLDGATATVELYYTAQADGDGLHEDAQTDTAQSGYDIQRKLYYAEKAQADPDTGTWTQFTAIADNTTFANAKAALLAYLKERTGGTVPISLKMTWEEVAQAPAFTGLLNETYGSGAEAAYSTRRLNGNVTDCMVIRRASDSTTTTIGFDGSGNIDESAINTFCSGTTCTVYQWLDQSGNGNTATAAAQANEPTIYTGGAIVKENGRVAVEFDGSDDRLIATSPSGFSGKSQSAFLIAQTFDSSSSNPDFYFGLGDASPSAGTGRSITQEPYLRFATTVQDYNSHHVQNAQELFSLVCPATVSTIDDYDLYKNGSFLTPDSLSGGAINDVSTGFLTIGTNTNQALALNGQVQELILYNSDKSTDRTSIESNIGDYFTQNTPLLDTYTGAAAAYSLRQISSTATNAVRVRRASDNTEQDIGFNVFGELDTVSLASFCSGTNGFVKVWYDQSGNANDATQSTTANQPKIYDSSTGVVTENGKPACDFNGSTNRLSATVSIANTDESSNFVVMRGDDVTGVKRILDHTTGADARNMSFVNSQFNVFDGSNGLTAGSASTATQYLMEGYFKTNDAQIYVNDSSVGTLSTFNQNSVSALELGYSSGNSFNGVIQEVVIWTSNQRTTNRSAIASNINTFYSIY